MAIKDIVKGICNITRCKYDVYTKDKTDEIVEEINTKINTKSNSEDVYTKTEIEEKVTEINNTLNEKANTTNVYVKGDYAVLTGSITLVSGAGNNTHNYPSGFTKDNSVVISTNIGNPSNSSISSSCGILSDVAGFATGAVYHRVSFRASDIAVAIDNGTGSGTTTYNYKVVIMKIS